jgi:hypothetical protein
MTRVLVVDDSESGRYLLETAMRSAGYEVVSAANGAAALEMARRHRPELVISDILMPGMDGFTFCRQLKEDPELRSIPVLFYSASYDDARDRALALAVGAERCITAPLEPSQLLTIVREVAEASQAGRLEVRTPQEEDDTYLRAYNEALVRQLERKVDEVEQANARLEQRVRQRTAELEISNRELEAFAYSVAHDLRAPLRAIDGYASRLAGTSMNAPLTESGRRFLALIQQNVQRMAQLIDDLLMLSRLGRQPLQKRHLQLAPLVEAALEDLAPTLRGRQVRIDVAPDLPDAEADPSLLRQALFNLLDNALKFTRSSAEARIEVGWRRDERGATVYFVRDNGVGFDMAHAPKLFQVFERLHRDDEFEGIGAGLAVVSRIIDRHGGALSADGKPGVGATFSFTLSHDRNAELPAP